MRDDTELDLLVQLQSLLLDHLGHVEVQLRVLGALDEPGVHAELDDDAVSALFNGLFEGVGENFHESRSFLFGPLMRGDVETHLVSVQHGGGGQQVVGTEGKLLLLTVDGHH